MRIWLIESLNNVSLTPDRWADPPHLAYWLEVSCLFCCWFLFALSTKLWCTLQWNDSISSGPGPGCMNIHHLARLFFKVLQFLSDAFYPNVGLILLDVKALATSYYCDYYSFWTMQKWLFPTWLLSQRTKKVSVISPFM